MAWNGRLQRGRVQGTHQSTSAGSVQRQLLPPQGLPKPDIVPGFSRARLPAAYELARKAISECARVDECKSWADKSAALASYARQAKDESLRIMADRIHARAVRRCGELLKQVPSGQGAKNQHGELRGGAVTRQEAATDAGLSERQRITALRLASVPAPEFETLTESDSPPTVTQLAELGRQPRLQPQPAAHPDTVKAARARKMFWTIREFCQENGPAELAGAFASQDADLLRDFAAELRQWLDQFVAKLPEEDREADNASRSSDARVRVTSHG